MSLGLSPPIGASKLWTTCKVLVCHQFLACGISRLSGCGRLPQAPKRVRLCVGLLRPRQRVPCACFTREWRHGAGCAARTGQSPVVPPLRAADGSFHNSGRLCDGPQEILSKGSVRRRSVLGAAGFGTTSCKRSGARLSARGSSADAELVCMCKSSLGGAVIQLPYRATKLHRRGFAIPAAPGSSRVSRSQTQRRPRRDAIALCCERLRGAEFSERPIEAAASGMSMARQWLHRLHQLPPRPATKT